MSLLQSQVTKSSLTMTPASSFSSHGCIQLSPMDLHMYSFHLSCPDPCSPKMNLLHSKLAFWSQDSLGCLHSLCLSHNPFHRQHQMEKAKGSASLEHSHVVPRGTSDCVNSPGWDWTWDGYKAWAVSGAAPGSGESVSNLSDTHLKSSTWDLKRSSSN